MDQHTQKKSSILRFFPFTKGFRGKFLLAFLMVIVAVVANYMTPQVIRVTVDSVINDTPFNLPAFLVEWIESIGGREMLRQHIVICAAVSLVFAVIAGLSNYSSRMSLARACEGTVARVRDTLFAHIQRLPYAWHNSHQTGDIIQRCTQDVELIRNFVSDQLMEVVRTLDRVLAMMFSLNGELSLLVCCFRAGADGSPTGVLRHHREEVPGRRRKRGPPDRLCPGEPHRRAGGAGLWPGAL